jgi:uncharacterized protein (TIGR02271 family)
MSWKSTEQFVDGMDVYDANDEKIGTVDEVYDTAQAGADSASGGGYLRVPTGFLGLGKEHHIPFRDVRRVEGNNIYLRVAKDELDSRGYAEAPAYADEEGAGYAETGRERTTTTGMTGAVERTEDRLAGAGGRAEGRVDETRERAEGLGREERRRLLLREEELVPRKRTVQAGEVRLQTEVVQEQRTVEVPLTREEVTVERHPVDRRPAERPIGEQGETISVPVREEEVTVEKRPVVYEEVEVGKRAVQETQQVDATLRREELREQRTDQPASGRAGESTRATEATRASGGGWERVMPTYQQRWQQRAGTAGGRWEEAEPAYRYGYDLRGQGQYRGRNWADIEPDVRRDWERRYPNTPWDRAKEGVRDAWEDVTNR